MNDKEFANLMYAGDCLRLAASLRLEEAVREIIDALYEDVIKGNHNKATKAVDDIIDRLQNNRPS